MATKAAKARVTLRHPNGKFTVSVSEERAAELKKRGYTAGGGKPSK